MAEMTPFEIAWSQLQWAIKEEPRNDWLSVGIARRHLEKLLAEHRALCEVEKAAREYLANPDPRLSSPLDDALDRLVALRPLTEDDFRKAGGGVA
jgi:hypothetical protein